MLSKGGDDSFLLFNETFSGTDDKRGCDFAISTAKSMLERGMFGLFVTHFHEIEYENFHVLQALVDADNNNTRTFKISRADRDGKSHATDILKKYGLDKYSLAERRK